MLSHLTQGQRNARITDELCISIRTVENHFHHIIDNLGVSSRIEAAIYALSPGLISTPEMSGISQDM